MKIYWLFFIVEGLLLQVMQNSYSIEIVLVLNFVILIVVGIKECETKNEQFVVFCAIIFRIIFLVLDVYFPQLNYNFQSGGDSVSFQRRAVIFSKTLNWGSENLYPETLGFVYYFFGPHQAIGELFNLSLSVQAIIFFKRLLSLIDMSYKNKFWAFLFFSLAPNFAMMSPIILRETIIILLITASLYYFVRWWTEGLFFDYVISVALPAVASFFHSGAIALSIGYLIVFVFYDRKKEKFVFGGRTFLTAIVTGVVAVSVYNVIGEAIFYKFANLEEIEDVGRQVSSFARGGSSYLIDQDNSSILQMLLNTPIRVFYFLSSPVPWQWRGLVDVLSFFLCSSIYLYAIWMGIRVMIKRERTDSHPRDFICVLFLFVISCSLLFAWGVSNAGTALRHREKFFSVFVLLLFYARDNLRDRYRSSSIINLNFNAIENS